MLHIWLPNQYSQLYVWLEKQQIWQAHESLQSISEAFSVKTACFYFPSQHVTHIESDLPSAQFRQLGKKGKRYLFEELSLAPVEQLYVRSSYHNGIYHLYACVRNDIEQWRNSASLVGIYIKVMFPDFVLLPISEDTDTKKAYLYADNHTTLARYSSMYGMAVNYFPSILDSLQIIDEIIIVPSVDESGTNLTEDLDQLNLIHSVSDTGLRPLQHTRRHKLNFMIKENRRILSPYLKITLIIAMWALILQIVADSISLYHYKKTTKRVDMGISAQYKLWFPEGRLNARTKLEAQVAPFLQGTKTTSGNGVSLLSRVTPLLKQSQIKATSLMADQDSLKLQLTANNRQELDSFVSRLTQQGITAKLGAITNQSKENEPPKVLGEVVISQQPN